MSRGRSRAHPRSRGENLTPAGRLVIDGGSSPLTRGKPCPPRRASASTGLIPAHAGKTTKKADRSKIHRAHPRSRGENEAGDEKGSTFDGSSPLTRGKLSSAIARYRRVGLIPAHAGKTRRSRRISLSSGAHPRSRGENSTTPGRRLADTGSSPLTRGKRHDEQEWLPRDGLIPAHAGKTVISRR